MFGGPGLSSWRLKILQDRLPVHHAIVTLSDEHCVEFFRNFETSDMSLDEWGKSDRFHRNALHIAAGALKVQSVRWLLENADQGQRLSSARTVEGYTPQEELESHLEAKRAQRDHGMMTTNISDNFSGYPSEAIECLAALRGVNEASETQHAKLKYGCTCGSCIDGFLSPRMKFALLCQAEITHDTININVDHGDFCDLHDVPLEIRQNMRTNKSLHQGHSNVFDHVATVLRADQAPTLDVVEDACKDSKEWPPHTRNYLQKGGNVESVLRVIFEQARDEDQWTGHGSFMETFEEDVNALTECRNDYEYGFLALACGISNLTRLYG